MGVANVKWRRGRAVGALGWVWLAACASGEVAQSGEGDAGATSDASVDAPARHDAAADAPSDSTHGDTGAPDLDGGCTPGAVGCIGDMPLTCVAGMWQPGALCPYACTNGVCTGSCTPGTLQCSGTQPQTCDATGSWQNSGSPCAHQCSMGTCIGACTSGAMQCAGLQPQQCSAGVWQNAGSACPYVCTAGTCTGSCLPGSTQCSNATPQSCDATGTWQSGSPCPYVCSGGSCTGVCVPGSVQCASDGTTPQTCSSAGTWSNGTACPYTCSAGTCAGDCTPNAMQPCSDSCGTTGTATCTASSTWGTCVPPPETCDLVDDNCDGRCDDVAGCRTGVDRSYNQTTGEHFYTTSDSEASCCGFTVETLDYYWLYSAQQSGLVPFYRCLLSSNFHLYTTSSTCEGVAGATNEGSMGWIASGAVCGSVPLYRLYNPASGDHLYTTSSAEVTSAEAGGYTLEFTAGYVWTASEG